MPENNEKTYVGNGWENSYGIAITIDADKVKGLPKEKYGTRLFVGRRKSPDLKTKATHWVAWSDYKPNKSEGDLSDWGN